MLSWIYVQSNFAGTLFKYDSSTVCIKSGYNTEKGQNCAKGYFFKKPFQTHIEVCIIKYIKWF